MRQPQKAFKTLFRLMKSLPRGVSSRLQVGVLDAHGHLGRSSWISARVLRVPPDLVEEDPPRAEFAKTGSAERLRAMCRGHAHGQVVFEVQGLALLFEISLRFKVD